MNKCINCQVEYYCKSKTSVCCSPHCRVEFKYKKYIELWMTGKVDGKTKAGNIIGYIRRHLFEINQNTCSICKWSKMNPYSKKYPHQIDHIDGDTTNNSIKNLRLLCPNCHSLTPTYGILNAKFKGINREYLSSESYKETLHNQKRFYSEED